MLLKDTVETVSLMGIQGDLVGLNGTEVVI